MSSISYKVMGQQSLHLMYCRWNLSRIGICDGFLGSDYQLLLVPRFDHLRSSIPDNASPALQEDVYKELLDYLGIERAFIFGNSAGGTSAIHFPLGTLNPLVESFCYNIIRL